MKRMSLERTAVQLYTWIKLAKENSDLEDRFVISD